MFKTTENLTIVKNQNTMNVHVKEYNYMSQFLERLPVGANINKSVCNSGATSIALQNKDNVILLCPTISLVQNKYNQYIKGNQRVQHSLIKVHGKINIEAIQIEIKKNKTHNWPIKIICTYDSFYKIENLIQRYNMYIIVDQSHKLLQYAHMKAQSKKFDMSAIDTIFRICQKYKHKTSFLSASPVPVKYMPQWVQQLQQVNFTWQNTSAKNIYMIKHGNPVAYLNKNIIQPMIQNGYFKFNSQIQIKKIIVFINSIVQIKNIIKTNQINSKDVAILCGTQSIQSIKPFKYLTNSSKLPKFTFITSTAFSGIDIIDKDALSIVISTTTQQHMMLNDALDLRQAISRQRLSQNLFFNTGLFIYNQTIFQKTQKQAIQCLYNVKTKIEDALQRANYREQNDVRSMQVSKNTIELLLGNTLVNVYTYLDQNNKLILNQNVFMADLHFILQTRRYYENGFQMKVNQKVKSDASAIEMNIESNSLPLYSQYAQYFNKYILDDYDWLPKFKNQSYKKMIKSNYQKYNVVFSSLAAALKNYKESNQTVNFKKLQKYIKSVHKQKFITGQQLKQYIQTYSQINNISKKIKIKQFLQNSTMIIQKVVMNKQTKKAQRIYVIQQKKS